MSLPGTAFSLIITAVVLLFLSSQADAQSAVNYRFLEVVDNNGQPVANANVEPIGHGSPAQTNKMGTLRFEFWVGDFQTTGFKVSKLGYFDYEETRITSRCIDNEEATSYDSPIHVVLLKIPTAEADGKTIEPRQHGRELIRAIKNRDVILVEKLLNAGVSPNTRDDHAISALTWAAANGDLPTIKALLAAHVDVRDKSKSENKALLSYLICHNPRVSEGQDHVDYELIQTLINAGIDVNAVNREDRTPLRVAREAGNTKLTKLLESAGAREPE